MAQISRREFEARRSQYPGALDALGHDAQERSQARSLLSALRISDVPRPVLAALVVLVVVATALGLVLRAQACSAPELLIGEGAQGDVLTDQAQAGGDGTTMPVTAADTAAATASTASSQSQQAAPAEAAAPSVILVHVDGSVNSPGVYELAETARVRDAVDAAGGLTQDADVSQVNLAAPVTDGSKVYIPAVGEQAVGTVASASPAVGGGTDTSVVNINTATLEELDTLPGVGESTAQAIIEEREAGGPFTSVEDIMRVSGIGEKKFERLQGLICV